MKLRSGRCLVIGWRIFGAIVELGLLVWILVVSDQNDVKGGWLAGILFLVASLILSGVLFLVLAIDEIGNLFSDKVANQIIKIDAENSCRGFEEFEERIEDEREDEELMYSYMRKEMDPLVPGEKQCYVDEQ